MNHQRLTLIWSRISALIFVFMFIFTMTPLSHGRGQGLQSPVFEMFFLPIMTWQKWDKHSPPLWRSKGKWMFPWTLNRLMLEGERCSEVLHLLGFHLSAVDLFYFPSSHQDSIVLLQKAHKIKMPFCKDRDFNTYSVPSSPSQNHRRSGENSTFLPYFFWGTLVFSNVQQQLQVDKIHMALFCFTSH